MASSKQVTITSMRFLGDESARCSTKLLNELKFEVLRFILAFATWAKLDGGRCFPVATEEISLPHIYHGSRTCCSCTQSIHVTKHVEHQVNILA